MAAMSWEGKARADEPWMLSLQTEIAIPVGDPVGDLFGPGITGAIGIERGIVPWFVAGLRLRAGVFTNGSPPRDPGRVNPGIATLYSAVLHARVRPFADRDDVRRVPGFWFELGGGVGLTGDLFRATIEVGTGWGFAVKATGLSPSIRLIQVIQGQDVLASYDARIISFGLELTFLDARPVSAEPEDDWEEEPGDQDGDTILDADDACVSEPEDFDEYDDVDGCPDPDNDGDGVRDDLDGCPLEAEDLDGFEDENGCPELDNERDEIMDVVDQCPNERETINGIDDHDGCPDEGLINFADNRIVLEETVLFDTERARVRTRARPVIAAIVALWRQHPEWRRVRIEGHADNRGDEDYNLQLSALRAERVRAALIEAGMPGDIIEHQGFGSSRPRDPHATEEGWARNRRVEFVVLWAPGTGPLPGPDDAPAARGPDHDQDEGGQK